MKSIIRLLPMLFSVIGLATGSGARTVPCYWRAGRAPSQTASGTYKIFVHKKELGVEHFQLSSSDRTSALSSDGQVVTDGIGIRIKSSLTVGPTGPVHYSVETGTGPAVRKYLIDFSGADAKATVESAGHSTERNIRLQKGFPVVLLDKGVWSQYRFLFMKYDMAEKGIQTFQAFVPVPALKYLKAEVEFDKPVNYGSAKEKIPANRFFVRLGDALGLIAIVAPDGWPLSIEVPTKGIHVTLERD